MANYARTIHIIGAGLAGSECAFQLAELGHEVCLYEMRFSEGSEPKYSTPAHKTTNFAELVCSNSFGSCADHTASGQLKWEAEKLKSLILKTAKENAVPAGSSLGIDREKFSKQITETIQNHKNIKVINKVIQSLDELPRPLVVATGPLTDMPLALDIKKHFKNEFLYFYDAIAPIIDADSIDYGKCWFGDRYDRGDKDYLNFALTEEQYNNFINEIKNARKIEAKDFENPDKKGVPYFDGCMPIEEMINRGHDTPRFGPMSPKGLQQQGPDFKKHAVIQLRKENVEATAFNMVGFQTKMAYPEQMRIFRMIPGLEKAEFLKLGSVHRNLYLNSPKLLNKDLSSVYDDDLYFAGQITGVEGYFDSTCIGLLVSRFLDRKLKGKEFIAPSRSTAIGSLYNSITTERDRFQPTNINFGLMPVPEHLNSKQKKDKRFKRDTQLSEAKKAFELQSDLF